jgi:hypothetical protein
MKAARFMQLVYQQEHDVRLTHTAQPARHLPKLMGKLPRRRRIELQHRQELAEPARGDARAVDCPDVPRRNPRPKARKALDAVAQQVVTSW